VEFVLLDKFVFVSSLGKTVTIFESIDWHEQVLSVTNTEIVTSVGAFTSGALHAIVFISFSW
jgi:hypothetical protein